MDCEGGGVGIVRVDAVTGKPEKPYKPLRYSVLLIIVVIAGAVVSCAHGKAKLEEPRVARPERARAPSATTLKQTIERLEGALSEREDQLTTLRQRLERITTQRDAYASELEQVRQERDKLREENEVLNKKLEEILAPKPPPSKPDIYIVQEGDTLESIAAKEDIYGDRSRWNEIFKENKDVIGSAPDNLVPGTKLIIPRP